MECGDRVQIVKVIGVVVFVIAGICGLTSVPGIQDSTSQIQTAVFSIACLLLSVLCGMSYRNGKRKAAKKMAELQEKESAAQEESFRKQQRMQDVLSMTSLPVEPYPEAIILNDGEICHYQIPAVSVVVKNQVVGRSGGGGGVSVRVAKGVTLHSGRSSGKTIRDDVPYFYGGVFSITNQRIIMTGEKGFDYPVNKLTSIVPYNYASGDGVTLQFGRSTHNLLVDEPYWIGKIVELIRHGAPVEA